jgi:arylformamidase
MAMAAAAAGRCAVSGDWIDVSVTLRDGMVHWPDNPPVEIERALSIARGDAANVSKLSLGAHTGTHMDAPVHFVPGGPGIDSMPLAATMGPARVIEIADPQAIRTDELRPHQIRAGERVLFKTRNSPRCWQSATFVEDFVYISADAARYLAEQRVQTVGVDYLSVGGYHTDGAETHRALLQAGVWIIEGLDLSALTPGPCELICLPLKIAGGDGAPARALVRPLSVGGRGDEG